MLPYHTVLSIDCANKSLAFTLARVVPRIYIDKQISETYKTLTSICFNNEINDEQIEIAAQSLFKLKNALSQWIVIVKSGVHDLLGGLSVKEVDSVFRTRCLKDTLNTLNLDLPADTIVIIEDQPSIINLLTVAIQAQLQYEFAHYSIIMMNPKLKNKINLSDEIDYKVFLQKCKSQYEANKAHSSANFVHMMNTFNLGRMRLGLQRGNTMLKYDDLADSFMQIIVYTQLKN